MVSLGQLDSRPILKDVSAITKELARRKIELSCSVEELIYGSGPLMESTKVVFGLCERYRKPTQTLLRLFRDVRHKLPGGNIGCMPLIQSLDVTKDSITVTYYPHIRFSTFETPPEKDEAIRGMLAATFSQLWVTTPVLDTLDEDLKHSMRKKKWDESRIESLFSKTVTSSLQKMTANSVLFTSLPESGVIIRDKIPAHIHRDIADAIVLEAQPAQVYRCETPEDYIRMYTGSPSSCMTGSDRHWQKLAGPGFHPALTYHYWPDTVGFFLAKGGRVLARTITSGSKPKTPTKYVRIYSRSDAARETLRTHINGLGITSGNFARSSSTLFKIPGTKTNTGDYIMGVPYVDGNSLANYYVTFIKETNEFLLAMPRPKKGEHSKRIWTSIPSVSSGSTIAASSLSSSGVECAMCSRLIPTREIHAKADNGDSFCSHQCTKNAGYVQSVDVNHASSLIRKTPYMIQRDDQIHHSVNIHASEFHVLTRNALVSSASAFEDTSILPDPSHWIHHELNNAFLHRLWTRWKVDPSKIKESRDNYMQNVSDAAYANMPVAAIFRVPKELFGVNYRGFTLLCITIPRRRVIAHQDLFWKMVEFLPSSDLVSNNIPWMDAGAIKQQSCSFPHLLYASTWGFEGEKRYMPVVRDNDILCKTFLK